MTRKIGWNELAIVLARLQPGWAIAGWAVSFLIIAALTLRWRILLSQQAIHLPLRTVLALTWAGQFFNSILPGSTGGDVMKIYQLCRIAPERKAAAVATIFVDRFMALLALLLLGLGGFLLEPAPLRLLVGHAAKLTPPAWAFLFVAFAVAAVAVGWLSSRVLRGRRWLGPLHRTLAAAKTNFVLRPKLFAVFALALATHFTNFFVVYLFARALGINITFPQVLVMMPVVLFLMLLPVTINGHGLRELLLIGYFTHMGIVLSNQASGGTQEIAVALSLLLVSNDLLWSLPGGIWYLASSRGRTADGDNQTSIPTRLAQANGRKDV